MPPPENARMTRLSLFLTLRLARLEAVAGAGIGLGDRRVDGSGGAAR